MKALRYWGLEERNQRLSVVEDDIRKLMKACDDSKSLLEKRELQHKKEIKDILLNFLDVLDAFDRVFKNIEDKSKDADRQTKIWIGNFRAIQKKMESISKNAGISLIEAPEGKAVPGWHSIVETKKVDGLGDDTVIEIIEKGYLWKGEVLRKSSVVAVSHKKEA